MGGEGNRSIGPQGTAPRSAFGANSNLASETSKAPGASVTSSAGADGGASTLSSVWSTQALLICD